jgi:serine/threonine protein kinase
MSKAILDEERAEIEKYLAANTKTPEERAHIVNDMYGYLAKSQEIIKMPVFRNTIINKITEYSSQPEKIIVIIKPGMSALCNRLYDEFNEYIEGCSVFGVESKAPIPYKILGKGAYGTVVRPGLPDINESDVVIAEFPGMVSKVMTNKKEFRAAVNAMEKIKKDVPALAYNFIPYKKPYAFKNLPENVKTEVGAELNINEDSEVYIARMGQFGVSISHIRSDLQLKSNFNALSEANYVRQFLRLFRVVKNIKDAGYVHGDIRKPNVLVDFTKNGKMTIIDFDLFMTQEKFFQKHEYHIHLPPEFALFGKNGRLLQDLKSKLDRPIYDIINPEIHNAEWITAPYDQKVYSSVSDVAKATYESIAPAITIDTDMIASVRKKCMDTLDMYSLATVLFGIMKEASCGTLGRCKHPNLYTFLYKEFFPSILEANPLRRITVEEAIDRLTDYARTNVPEIQLGEMADPANAFARMSAAYNIVSARNTRTRRSRRLARKTRRR